MYLILTFNITLEEVESLEPGIPYIFIPEEDEIHIYYYASTATPSASSFNGLYGTFEQIMDGAAGDPGNNWRTTTSFIRTSSVPAASIAALLPIVHTSR